MKDIVFQKVWTQFGEPKLLIVDRYHGTVLAVLDEILIGHLQNEWKSEPFCAKKKE